MPLSTENRFHLFNKMITRSNTNWEYWLVHKYLKSRGDGKRQGFLFVHGLEWEIVCSRIRPWLSAIHLHVSRLKNSAPAEKFPCCGQVAIYITHVSESLSPQRTRDILSLGYITLCSSFHSAQEKLSLNHWFSLVHRDDCKNRVYTRKVVAIENVSFSFHLLYHIFVLVFGRFQEYE